MDRLQAMTTFVRVVENGSFSGAAKQLNVGQPAVSKTIAQLEDRLQVRLLLRSTHGLTPTEAGQRFYERARRAIEEANEAELEARGAGAGLSGRLRVSAATTFARLQYCAAPPGFLKANPDLEIDVILDDRVIDLVAEGVDMALRMGELPDFSGGRSQACQRPALGNRHARLSGTLRHPARVPAELGSHQALIYSQASSGWTFKRGSAETSVSVHGRVRVSAAEGLRAAVLAHMGLTIASDWMFSPELESGAVRRVLEAWALPTIDLWAVFPTGRLASAKARAFAAFVEGALAH